MNADHRQRTSVRTAALLIAMGVALGGGEPAAAQLLGRGLPGLPSGALPSGLPDIPTTIERQGREAGRIPNAATALPPQILTAVGDVATASLAEVRRLAAERLLREHPDVVEADDRGQPVVRGEVLALDASAAALAQLRRAGFTVRSKSDLGGLGVESLVLRPPRGVSAVEAIRRLRALDPAGQYDFNHLYQESGAIGGIPQGAASGSAATDARGLRIGLVDGAVAASRPALARARLVQRPFAAGGARPTGHATAIASLLVGAGGKFRAAAPGASLYVADVYGPTPTGGSAEAVARALAWLAQSNVPVINISLVGPPNLLLGAAVQALIARGHLVVAAVGNDGPAAPPLYPAAYPGVIAVTGVDAQRRVLPEAGRGTHVDFAAPGSDMAVADLTGGFVSVRGTSFAAPIVAGQLARRLPALDRAAAARAVAALALEAVDLGAPGDDPVYGRGLVGFDLRTDPAAVGARTGRPRP